MKYLKQILLIMLFTCLGELLHAGIPAPIPASIYGMVLMFLALSLKIIKVEAVADAGGFLVSFLPVLFVVPLVSLMDYWDAIKNDIVPIFIIILVSTLLVFFLSGRITQWIIERKGGKDHE